MIERPSDRPDFVRVYDEWFPRVYNYLVYALADVSAADDAASAVFEKALAAYGSYDPARGRVDAWLFGIARNAVADHHRSGGRRTRLPFERLEARPDGAPAAEDALALDESKRELVAALARLEPRERAVLALKFGADLGNREIAAQEGLGESHVGVIVYRAVKKLQAALGEKGKT